jgi:DNA-binding PadR family transcriptional regulator
MEEKMSKKPIRQERMRDVISYRLTDAQRAFLEDISEQQRIGLGEAARTILDEAMKNRGLPA